MITVLQRMRRFKDGQTELNTAAHIKVLTLKSRCADSDEAVRRQSTAQRLADRTPCAWRFADAPPDRATMQNAQPAARESYASPTFGRTVAATKYAVLAVAALLWQTPAAAMPTFHRGDHLSPSSVHAMYVSHRHEIQAAAAYVDDGVPMGDKIVAFARDQTGHSVGDGECYDLADQALLHAGAKSAPAYGRITGDADYVWGVPVTARDAKPGDIVQFHNYTIKTTVTGIDASQRWVTEIREHHTAIVERNLGGQLALLEQNVEPSLVVQRTVIPVVDETIRGSSDGDPNAATTTFEVTGQANIYRPQAARPRLLVEN